MGLASLVCAALLLGSNAKASNGLSSDAAKHDLFSRQQKSTMDAAAGSSGYRTVGYFVNWAIYARNYNPQDLPADELTHVNYAFANIRQDSGEVYLTDSWADVEKHYPTDSWNDSGNNVYGCIKQLNLLKRKHRKFKVMLSVGGWTYSSNFAAPFSTESGRTTFANSCVNLLKDLGFDGIDIDYEYPKTTQQASDYVLALKALRKALDAYAVRVKRPAGTFLLTVASPAGPENYKLLNLKAMDGYLDFWNLMAYDYAGGFSNATGHLANWSPSKNNPAATPFDTAQAIEYYQNHGVASKKIVLGVPLYGRGFASTEGMGKSFQGVGAGKWEAGVYDWKDLPLQGAIVKENDEILASWSKDEAKREVISFDNMAVMKKKAGLVKDRNLGGVMWWEMSGDRTGQESAVSAQVNILRSKLDAKLNELSYPESKYDNLRAGFPSG